MTRRRGWTLVARVTALCVGTGLALGLIALTAAVVAIGHQGATQRLIDRGTPLVLDAQTLLTIRQNRLTASVALIEALGGGWSATTLGAQTGTGATLAAQDASRGR